MGETFDAVIAQAMLEYVVVSYQCVDEIVRVLKPTGLVYAETPFMRGDVNKFVGAAQVESQQEAPYHSDIWHCIEEITTHSASHPEGKTTPFTSAYTLACIANALHTEPHTSHRAKPRNDLGCEEWHRDNVLGARIQYFADL